MGWKPGLQHKRLAGPFVVVEVLPEPVYAQTEDAGEMYFLETPMTVPLSVHPNEAIVALQGLSLLCMGAVPNAESLLTVLRSFALTEETHYVCAEWLYNLGLAKE